MAMQQHQQSSSLFRQWLVQPTYHSYVSSRHSYCVWLTEDKQPCLAKVLQYHVKRSDVKEFLDLNYDKNIHGNCICVKIQVGPSNKIDIHSTNRFSFWGYDDPNILVVPTRDLIELPVPIDCTTIIARNKINIMNQSNTSDIKWTINETDYNNGYKICMNALQYAKCGNWDEFQQLNATCQILGHTLTLSTYVFFDQWSILDEANAHHRTLFCLRYIIKFLKNHVGVQLSDRIFEIACKYGHLKLLQSDDIIDQDRFYNIEQSLHFAIDNNHYNILKWFINQQKHIYTNSKYNNNNNNSNDNDDDDYTLWFQDYKCRKKTINKCLQGLRNNSNILGTAIENNNLKMVKLIIEWNQYIKDILYSPDNIGITSTLNDSDRIILTKQYNKFNVDNFVWCDQTAIQSAFLLCNDNFELLKYLLNQHNPNYTKYSLNKLNNDDNYIKWGVKRAQRQRTFNIFGEIIPPSYYEIDVKTGLIGSITYKPDCEGYTIQERINLSKQSNILTNEQCAELQQIYDEKISQIKKKNDDLPVSA